MKAVLKRTVDLLLALILAPVALPLVAIAGLLIAIESPGGPFYFQTRIGKGRRPFVLFKLRTMVANAERIGAGLYAEKNDARFTRMGTLARRLSLDELPQLANVLLGDMSIVGPRPMLQVTTDEYREAYDVILTVKPGLTGLVQVSGRNRLTRSERLELDATYARTWSLAGDFAILSRTVGAVLSGEGQMNTQGRDDVER